MLDSSWRDTGQHEMGQRASPRANKTSPQNPFEELEKSVKRRKRHTKTNKNKCEHEYKTQNVERRPTSRPEQVFQSNRGSKMNSQTRSRQEKKGMIDEKKWKEVPGKQFTLKETQKREKGFLGVPKSLKTLTRYQKHAKQKKSREKSNRQAPKLGNKERNKANSKEVHQPKTGAQKGTTRTSAKKKQPRQRKAIPRPEPPRRITGKNRQPKKKQFFSLPRHKFMKLNSKYLSKCVQKMKAKRVAWAWKEMEVRHRLVQEPVDKFRARLRNKILREMFQVLKNPKYYFKKGELAKYRNPRKAEAKRVEKGSRTGGNRIVEAEDRRMVPRKDIRPSKCRSKNGMNLADTIEFEDLAKDSPQNDESGKVNFQSLIHADNSIKKTNREYVEFIKEIEEFSPEKSPKKPNKTRKKKAEKGKRRNEERKGHKKQSKDSRRGKKRGEEDDQLHKFIEQVRKRKSKAKMFNWLLEIYVHGYEKESQVVRAIQLRKKRNLFGAWKKAMRKLKKENRRRERENQELVDSFRRIILTSKALLTLKSLRAKRQPKS